MMVTLVIKNTNLILNKAIMQAWKARKYSYESSVRPDHGLLYLFSGKITYTFDESKIELKSGDIIYLPKGSNYEVNFDLKNGIVEDYLINFDVMGEDGFTDIYKPTCILRDHARVLADCFKETVNAYNEKDKPFLTNSLFYLCLNSLQTAIQSKDGNKERLIFEKAADRPSAAADRAHISLRRPKTHGRCPLQWATAWMLPPPFLSTLADRLYS